MESQSNIDYSKIGIGIITCKSPERFKHSIASVPDGLTNVVVVNDGTPYDLSVYPKDVYLIQHVRNKGVAAAKNSAIRYLHGIGCEHIFLMEDDIIIKDPVIFKLYPEASRRSGIKHFNYALQGYGNARRDESGMIIHPTPNYCVDYNGLELCFYTWCSGPFMYIHRDCVDAVGYLDEAFYNVHEHVDYTARIIEAGLHPPFWFFADLSSAHNYIADSPLFRETTIPKTPQYYEGLKGADIYFQQKHQGYTPDTMPRGSNEDLLLYLLNAKPGC